MPTPAIQRHQTSYTDEEVERGIFALVMASGNTRRASRTLAARGLRVPHQTLHDWRHHTHPERYERMQRQTYPAIQARMAEQMEELLQAQIDLEWKLVEKLDSEVDDLRPGEAAGALRNIAVTKAINVDKSSLLRGAPTEIVEHHDVAAIIEKLKRLGVVRVISEQEEPVDADSESDAP